MPNRRKKSFRDHRARKIAAGQITRLERGEELPKVKPKPKAKTKAKETK